MLNIFEGCSKLSSVTIGNSVDWIEDFAFYKCNNLHSIVSLNSIPPQLNREPFSDETYYRCTLYVPKGSKKLYSSYYYPTWNEFKGIVELDESDIEQVTIDNPDAFLGIYTINGIKQSSNADNLPKGIYIKNGKKVIIK